MEKGTYKGKLFYEAEFVPALHVKNVKFSSGPNAIERVVQGGDDADGDTISQMSGASEENQAVLDGITVSAPLEEDEQIRKGHKKSGSADTTNTTNTTRTVDTQLTRETNKSFKTTSTNGEKRPEDDAPDMSVDELLQHREC